MNLANGYIFVGGIGVIIAILLVVARLEKLKCEKFQRFAESKGLEYRSALGGASGFFASISNYATESQEWISKYAGFRPFGNSSESIKHLFQGHSQNMPFEAFQYQYTTGSGKSRTTHSFAVASLVVPAILPSMAVTKEGILDQVGKMFGGQDIQFESEEFNRRLRVVGPNVRAVHACIDPKMMEFLLGWSVSSLQVETNRVVVHCQGIIEEEYVASTMEFLPQFWNNVPQIVKEGKVW